MSVAPKKVVKVELGGKNWSVDNRIWQIFETMAGDKKPSLITLVGEYVKEGKSVERALTDALEMFKLVSSLK
jgi:hypothetical protein